MTDFTIVVARDYTETPGGRYAKDGDFSGELFRNSVVMPHMKDVMSKGGILFVNLDGTAGYATSFLEEAFGGLVREMGVKVSPYLRIESENTLRKREVESYISDAEARLP